MLIKISEYMVAVVGTRVLFLFVTLLLMRNLIDCLISKFFLYRIGF